MKPCKLGELIIGEPDANVEQYIAMRAKESPNFIRYYYTVPNFSIETFLRGEKTFLLGQKGTGKTAILRKIHSQASEQGAECEFIVFKSTILEEVDLLEVQELPFIDDKEMSRAKHYYHVLKRIVLLVLASKLTFQPVEIESADVAEDDKNLLKRVLGSPVVDVIRLGFESVFDLLRSSKLSLDAASDGLVSGVDEGRFIKKSNDTLTRFILRSAKKQNVKLRIFFDEVHFAYRSDESLRNDAMLVRDLLHVCSGLNGNFAERGLDIVLYAAVRSEFLQHPIIKDADIVHMVESSSFSISWHEYKFNRENPLFSFIGKRLIAKGSVSPIDPHVFLSNITIENFLSHTWAKPRDLVRFFKSAQELFPEFTTLTSSQIKTVLNKYSESAWEELESGAAAFLPEDGRQELSRAIRSLAPRFLDGSAQIPYSEFCSLLQSVYERSQDQNRPIYTFEHFMQLLYILGVYFTEKRDSKGQLIYHAYHRGNKFPQEDGAVRLHRAILLAFG